MAALRAAVFSLSSKKTEGFLNNPPIRARVNFRKKVFWCLCVWKVRAQTVTICKKKKIKLTYLRALAISIHTFSICTRDATFRPQPFTGTAPHHRIANNYRQLPADYGSLPADYRHLYGFHYKGCLTLPSIYRQGWSIYRRLPPIMKNYRHVGNAVMKSCTSNLHKQN